MAQDPTHIAVSPPIEGPRFIVTTWREEREPHGLLWFARVVLVRPEEAAPFIAVIEGRRLLPDAVRAAVAGVVRGSR